LTLTQILGKVRSVDDLRRQRGKRVDGQEGWPSRERDVSSLKSAELERMHRELVVAAGLSKEGSGARAMILTEMMAVEAELAGRLTESQAAAS